MSQHLDAEVLDLCTRLRAMQAEWQRLYDATSEEAGPTTPADHAWSEYSNMVWPAVRLATWGDNPLHSDDVPGPAPASARHNPGGPGRQGYGDPGAGSCRQLV